ncbi:MAG TPA: TIGR01777 family oxidoreductase [Xanthobacteraceae bacterium]|nr:TIGR01777 family oxidoreductase [Xanthobacteraceae bacterium]
MTTPLWTLILAQIAMGAFDIIYHHELTERLAWRPTQRRELALHAVRNVLYAVLFVTFGWFEPRGAWAALIISVLVIEIFITLMDFVEEDLSRKLPGSERINHTLLAINYGAILALLIPVLLGLVAQNTSLTPVNHGVMSAIATVAAMGVIGFGARDFYTSWRVRRLSSAQPDGLAQSLTGRRQLLVTGATGFVGRRLVEALTAAGHHVTVLTRDSRKAETLRPPFRVVTSLDQIANDAAIDGVINLAGEPIADGLWTRARRRRILRSRLRVTRDVVRLIARLDRRPEVLISGSATGWYGLWQDEALTEFDGGKSCFTHRVCEAWERAAMRARSLGVRVVLLRIGLVLGTEGGLLGRLLTPFEYGLGGPVGHGTQWMSWIERDDLVRLIAHILATPGLGGPVNATAPEPVRNIAFVRELGRVLNRPARLRAPAALLHWLAGAFADELLIGGQKVLPAKAEDSGFRFRHATLASAFDALLGAPAPHSRRPSYDTASPDKPHHTA